MGNMSFVSGIRDFCGLDIGTSSIRLVRLRDGSEPRVLMQYGYVPVDPKLSQSESPADKQKLGAIIKDLINAVGVTTKNVAVGIPSHRVFTTVVDLDRLSDSEIAQTIRLQAESIIPTPLAESKIDWAVIGDSALDTNKVEVLLSSVSNDYVEAQLDMLESIGLNIIAFEPDTLALSRSLIPTGANGMHMIVDMGNKTTDIVVSMLGSPRLTRTITTGRDTIIKAAMQNLNIDATQADQFVSKFGLVENKLEGQIRTAILGTIDILVGEIEKSIKYINTRYPNSPLDRIIMTGGASTLPEFPLYVSNKFKISVEIGNAWRNVSFPVAQQNELMALSNQFAVAAGLAERAE